MAGIVALQIKIMPDSPEANLDEIKSQIEDKLKQHDAKVNKMEEQDIAFGLKAIIVTIVWQEDKETDLAENSIKEIEHVSSTEITDYRRAFG
ncbi:MAG: elongation factor 1-beta [Nanoarchaeota archaeon]|nr:elongation factor 1-beta [Nanoarchaeota archaeon]